MKEASSNYKQTDIEMSVAPAPALVVSNKNVQIGMLKNMVLDPGWFDSDWTRFKDWWRGIRLFLKSNRVMETDNRITVILAHLREGVVGIYCHMQAYLSKNYISIVISSPNYTSLPSIVAVFLTTCLMVELQPSGYFIFYSRDTPIQLGLLWQSYFCQCLNTETFSRGNRGFTTETLSIF